MFKTGDIVGPYTLEQPIGSGGFGDVWLALTSGFVKTKCAVKLPNAGSLDMSVFESEAAIWAQATGHTNIVPIIGADQYPVIRDGRLVINEQTVIVSEYIADGSLAQRLDRSPNGFLAVDAACDMMNGILDGLGYLHSLRPGIIHRDLKPDNILMQGETPRLTDFGISSLLGTAAYLRAELITGTLPYLAPEVFQGRYSAKSDIWAAGVVFFQLLTGVSPFARGTMPEVIAAIANEYPKWNVQVPSSIRAVVGNAMSKDQAQRYGSAAEMRSELNAARRGQYNSDIPIPGPVPPMPVPDLVIPPIDPYPAPEPVARRRWAIAAGVVGIVVLLFAGVAAVSWFNPGVLDGRTKAAADPATNAPSPSPVNTNISAPVQLAKSGQTVATGTVQFETTSQEVLAPDSGAISQWLYKPGEFVNPCGDGSRSQMAMYKHDYIVETDDNGGTAARTDDKAIVETSPYIFVGASVKPDEEFYAQQPIARISLIDSIYVNAVIQPQDLARLHTGTPAALTVKNSEPGGKSVLKGKIDSIDNTNGKIRIKIADDQKFDASGTECLRVKPKSTGDVSFEF